MRKFQEKYPNITFTGTVKSSEQIYKLVEENAIDFGIAFEEVNRFDVAIIDIFYTDLVFVVNSANNILKKTRIHWHDLTSYPTVTLTDTFYTRKMMDLIGREKGHELNITMDLDQISFLKSYVCHTDCIGVFPEFAVLEELRKGQLRKINYTDNKLGHIKTVIIQRKDKFQSHAMKAFLGYLLREIEDPSNFLK